MFAILEMIYEYQLLLAKEARLSIALDDDEKARLVGLSRILVGDSGADPRRAMPRLPAPLSVQFTVPGGFGSGVACNISGGGLSVTTTYPAPIGVRTIVRIADSVTGIEYVFPGRIAWRVRDGSTFRVGVAFDGVPARAPFMTPPRGVWRDEVRFGTQARSAPSTC